MNETKQECRVCGCTETNACRGGCSWIEPNLCSNCQYAEQAKADLEMFLKGEFEGRSILDISEISIDECYYGTDDFHHVVLNVKFVSEKRRAVMVNMFLLDSSIQKPEYALEIQDKWKIEVNMYEDVWEEISAFDESIKNLYIAIM